MSRYTTLSALKRYTGISGTSDDGLLQECLDRAEGAIDDYTRRNFLGTSGTMYASRYEEYRVIDQAFWLREDLHTLVSLTLGNGQSIPLGSVWLQPREGPPYRAIRLRSSYVYTWNTDQDMIIAGTWGYGTTVPDDVIQATIRYATHLYRQKDATTTDVVGFQEGAQYTQPKGMPDDVRLLLAPYRSRTGGAV